ncbi:ABC transporter ATP-binding protein [Lactobacillus corticis]|uniref:ABC transporter ATP-binding protein n=1 Tax=Lactobacillus corticis TaxID=2201249 RepID=A0A916VJ22_9LACO|nr:ABC transporter ATP-binding protein [Lactobacillus corticis]GFZ26849.1 ABC transporter ATP-binding protein [Lactobacillus corticis]
MSYLELQHVSKTIKQIPVLEDVNLSLVQGKIYGFVGENGSGKTMLFRAILGFIKTSGTISIAGQKVKLNQKLPVNTGTIIETPHFMASSTGWENLKYLASLNHLASDEDILAAMKVFGLDQKRNLKVKQYSLGMRQQLAIIQSFMEGQELLILDEPTNGLDDKSVDRFIKLMKDLRDQGKTILISSHERALIEKIADETFEMAAGHCKALK